MTDLASRALLASLSIRQWSARKYDKRETQELMLKHNLNANVARVNKSLLPGADKLEAIHKKTNAVRWAYYDHSAPWTLEGAQIIRSDAYMDFVSMMRDHMWEWRALVRDFVDAYPQLRDDARRVLNGLFRDEDYPAAGEIAGKFDIDIKFFPVPSANDWRVSLADHEMEELRRGVLRQVREAEAAAMQDVWSRISKLVEKTRERLADPEAVFRDSLVENARELCKILPTLNISDDPALERVRSQLEGSICKHEPDVLREDKVVRQSVADKMAELQAKLGAMYGAAA